MPSIVSTPIPEQAVHESSDVILIVPESSRTTTVKKVDAVSCVNLITLAVAPTLAVTGLTLGASAVFISFINPAATVSSSSPAAKEV